MVGSALSPSIREARRLLISPWQTLAVRWERLFDDLSAQLEAAQRDELVAEVADRTRREVARIRLADRLRSAEGATVVLTVAGAGVVRGALRRVGNGWLVLDGDLSRQLLVAVPAVLAARGLPAGVRRAASTGVVESRLDLGHVLRALARDRTPVAIVLRDSSVVLGTVDRVGADFVDVAAATVAFDAITVVREG
jgi:hypothetical protein